MADVVAGYYRFVSKDKEGKPVRVVLEPGDNASNLPDGVVDQLKKDKVVVDEALLDPKTKQRIPGAVVAAKPQPETTEVGVAAKKQTEKK